MNRNQLSNGRDVQELVNDHLELTRRYFLKMGSVGVAALQTLPLFAEDAHDESGLRSAIASMESWLTPSDKFRDVSRGKPKPPRCQTKDVQR
ncbi:MAG: hypothetical protein WAO83_11155 [Fuerstiella sp.]